MTDWQTAACKDAFKIRAHLLRDVRLFFQERDILEVETPLLSQHTVTDLHLQSFSTNYQNNNQQQTYYLQTSPEYAMKRLLAGGCGSIFQICKAFRNGEYGHQHNPEFTLLEWYHLGFDHHQLMSEVDDLLQAILGSPAACKISYHDLFMQHFNINPHQATSQQLSALATQQNITTNNDDLTTDDYLNLLLTHKIESTLGREQPVFIYDYPVTQAALAKIRQDPYPVAERFELYINGIELANGFHELTDNQQQQHRFEQEQQARKKNNQPIPEIDKRLIAALQAGLPSCAGVALGIDRLLMLACKTKHIKEVLSFAWQQA